MIKKYNFNISFKWFDLWIGVFVDMPGKAVYICPLPMLVLKIWTTDHLACPTCGKPMDKTAFDTGDGWGLSWACDDCGDSEILIEWDMDLAGIEYVNERELERRGYRII